MLRERSSRSLVGLHLSPNHEYEFLFAVFRGSQDLACEKKVKHSEMLDFWGYKDVWCAQSLERRTLGLNQEDFSRR